MCQITFRLCVRLLLESHVGRHFEAQSKGSVNMSVAGMYLPML